MRKSLQGLLERAFLRFARMVPARLGAHVMHILKEHPAIPDRWGYHVRPIHYYEPIPDFRAISRTDLAKRRLPQGFIVDIAGQVERMSRLARLYASEIRAIAKAGFPFQNEYFGGLDAAVYYGLVRELKPTRIIEIGAGFSTQIAARALAANGREGRQGELIVVEPFPQPRLTEAGLEMQLIIQGVEHVPIETFEKLKEGDILFIDSSHALRFGGDVFREFLEIIPRLSTGVWVHIHDIFFPFDYPAEWLLQRRLAFNEQYLLEAFLAFNADFKVELANQWLATDVPDATRELFDAPVDMRPSSFWMARHRSSLQGTQ